MKFYTHYFLCPLVLFITLGCLDTNGQSTKPDAHKNNTTVKPTIPDTKTPAIPAIDDSVIQERLVALALTGPLYDASFHEVKVADYKVKAARKSWFNLLTLSLNYNDQTFAAPVAGQQYVYPKYFFGLVIPVGTIVSKGSEIKGAKEGVKIAQDNRDNMARTIRTDVLSKYTQYKTYRSLVVLESQVTDDIHAAFLQAEKRFNDGSVTIEVYSEASRNYTSEMTKLLNLQLQQDLIKLAIEQIIGVKLETVLN